MRMRTRRSKVLVEPPASATGDIAFNLIVFFLVCASVQPDSGRSQTLPRSEEIDAEEKVENIEVQISRNTGTVLLNGDPIRTPQLVLRLKTLLANKKKDQDRVVIVKSKPDTTYFHWIDITGKIVEAGGIITIQTEEEREVRIE
ncbi:MAG: biopolymer transport protein ExbD [Pirellulaceae bacterium]|jgi:biopolymer transport protein ExbD